MYMDATILNLISSDLLNVSCHVFCQVIPVIIMSLVQICDDQMFECEYRAIVIFSDA